jgi:GT2 family glycosyltransferase
MVILHLVPRSVAGAQRLAVAASATLALPVIAATLAGADVVAALRRRLRPSAAREFPPLPATDVSFIILNWNGRELLRRGLPSVVAAARPGDEVMLVDNGSTDGSVELVRTEFPTVRLVELPTNLGFSAGNNAGARAASNDIIVLLNSDMVVEPDFVGPLVEALGEADVFAATAQIFRLDPLQPRHETGRTAARFAHGSLALSHVPVHEGDRGPHPVLWAGGGSTAYDRRKFLALGGLDELFSPAYVEDLALSYAAWKRGWASLFVPASWVHHEHRGTSRRVFGDAYVDRLISRNQLLFMWRHMSWRYLWRHLAWLPAHVAWLATQHSPRDALGILQTALRRLPRVARGRASELDRRVLSDAEVLGKSSANNSGEPFSPGTADTSVRIADGWYPFEETQDPPFRWTGRRAEAFVNVEEVPAEIRVNVCVPDSLLVGVRNVCLRVEFEPDVHQTHRLRSAGRFVATVPISAGRPGWRRLSMELNHSVQPAARGLGADARDLGIQVFDITLNPTPNA